ncbi:hypothetical protein M404DRAFT_30447 [Pisolithus tinctorius Marx 270]|uniref:Reverse transcriptase domain-containing protein n=1 Tax=Pisolithus tinctorius Marx 270 TaxID=870435 RepID=A0A0C3NVG5_PISTI|nr:hypothetical protein M404DRAFT_30447 [Pisolithus tinctorius Marx 270]
MNAVTSSKSQQAPSNLDLPARSQHIFVTRFVPILQKYIGMRENHWITDALIEPIQVLLDTLMIDWPHKFSDENDLIYCLCMQKIYDWCKALGKATLEAMDALWALDKKYFDPEDCKAYVEYALGPRLPFLYGKIDHYENDIVLSSSKLSRLSLMKTSPPASFIHPTSSPYAALVLFIKKKDGSLQLCVDFHSLNKITKKDQYLLPLISDLLDSPSQAKIYTKINLQHAYHLIQIALGDEWKTTFWTWYGSYEWLVMPFGLTNALATFQCFINTIFMDMLDICMVVYLDDILVYSGDKESHKQHV